MPGPATVIWEMKGGWPHVFLYAPGSSQQWVLDNGFDPWTRQPLRAKDILTHVPGSGSPEGEGHLGRSPFGVGLAGSQGLLFDGRLSGPGRRFC